MAQKEEPAKLTIRQSVRDGEKAKPRTDLVSVGFPVRNGGQTLRNALDSILTQDYENLEIIISDNVSTDNTASIALEYQRRDPRIIYHRQSKFITALENFRFVLDKARGEYFMWAAHDDTRSHNFVSSLVIAMNLDPGPILTFGDLYRTVSIEEEGCATPYKFENTNLHPFQRMRKAANINCCHFYGLWRTGVLRSIRIHNCILSPDLPIMLAAAYLGTFKYVSGPKFIYLAVEKSSSERALYQDGKRSFNKYDGMLQLLLATYKTSAAVGGNLVGLFAAFFVGELHARNLPNFFLRKWKKKISQLA